MAVTVDDDKVDALNAPPQYRREPLYTMGVWGMAPPSEREVFLSGRYVGNVFLNPPYEQVALDAENSTSFPILHWDIIS